MNSINENRPEKNREDVTGGTAVEKIREIAGQAKNCFFCTSTATGETGETGGARPMNVRQVDDQGNLWFLSASDSHTNQEIELDSAVRLYFQGSPHSDFLHLNGRATISRDKAKIEELWEPTIKTWFTGGKDDPRITVIKVAPTDGYYWDTKHGNLVAGLKIRIGALVGKTMDDSIEGKARV